jgi:hypothetical protein
VVADGEKPDDPRVSVVPGRTALSPDMKRKGNDFRQEGSDWLLASRTHAATTVSERCDYFARLRKFIDGQIDTPGG